MHGVMRSLLIKLTCGADAPERCAQALNVAVAALAAGANVSLWLTGEASWLAVPGRAADIQLPHAAPFDELVQSVLDGGSLTVCSQCAARRELVQADLLPGTAIRGAAAFVEEALRDGTQALVY